MTTSPSLTENLKTNRRGFSLIEVIIALGIVSLMLTGFLGVFGGAQKNIQRSLGSKEVNQLKNSLEAEMSVLRKGESTIYSNPFHKAFKMIKDSDKEGSAIIVYKYRAQPVADQTNGLLLPFTGSDPLPGKGYITQTAVRKLDTQKNIITQELNPKSVDGNVYVVRLTQLVPKTAGGKLSIILGERGVIKQADASSTEASLVPVASSADYTPVIIAFQAEFFRLPTNDLNFITAPRWDFTKLGRPLSVINLAVRK